MKWRGTKFSVDDLEVGTKGDIMDGAYKVNPSETADWTRRHTGRVRKWYEVYSAQNNETKRNLDKVQFESGKMQSGIYLPELRLRIVFQ